MTFFFFFLTFWGIFSACFGSLKVVAVAVFMALGFAFYVFFAPFVGKRILQLIIMGIYSPLVSAPIF